MVKVAVCLSGCGVFDGAEIHESVITLLALDRAGAEVLCCAPDIPQMHVIDHQRGAVAEGESRNVRVESARIARGPVADVAELRAADFDALILPGGFGAAKNLCDFAINGAESNGHPAVMELLRDCLESGKPVGLMCIAPVVMATAMRSTPTSLELTIGTDVDTCASLQAMGAQPRPHHASEIHVDVERKVVSTPAYMLAGSISEAAVGIEKLVAKVLELCE
jgi:enhancing lycopene biosynthesis protein 2